MDLRRRQVLAGAGVGLAAGFAGCAGGPTIYEASPATVDRAVLGEVGYEHYRDAEVVVQRSFGPRPVQRDVEVRSAVGEYDRGLDLPTLGRLQAAVFAVVSTPQVRVLGHGFNPIGDMSTDDLAEAVQEHYGSVRDLSRDEDLSMSLLDTETQVTRYRGSADLLSTGASLGIYLYVAEAVAIEEDYVLGLAAHPRPVGRREGTVRRLLGGVRYPPLD